MLIFILCNPDRASPVSTNTVIKYCVVETRLASSGFGDRRIIRMLVRSRNSFFHDIRVNTDKSKTNSVLYLVATPIGNYDDITLRALNILKDVDFIICEEFKEARRLLSHYQIDKPLLSVNEHNEKETANDILLKLLAGETAALISDCGTPLFSDPGHLLVQLCISQKIRVVPVPGANSILPALTGSGFDFEKFYYYGWLSPKKDIRRQELIKLKTINEVIVIMDTPYRLRSLLGDMVRVFNPGVPIVVAFELTKKGERFYRGSLGEIQKLVENSNLKGEFVLILNNKRR